MNHGWRVSSLSDLVDTITERAGSGRPGVVALNGHSSSGKTTLAGRLAEALPNADVLHSDDLAWHQGVFGWYPLLIEDVLPIVRSRTPVDYRPPQWIARDRSGSVRLRGSLDFLIVEGVGSNHPDVRHELDFAIWVETDEPTRSARTHARIAAGEDTASGAQRWMVEENDYVGEAQPWSDADLLVEGGDSIPYDRNDQVVVSVPAA